MKPSSVWIGSVFTVFQNRNRTKLIGLVRFGLVRLIGLFKNTIKKIHILTKYFIDLCIIVFHILFFHVLYFSNNFL